MKIPKVLITGNHKENDDLRIFGPATFLRDFIAYPFYLEGFLPLVIPAVRFNEKNISEIAKIADLIVLSGGKDVDPLIYNEEVRYDNVERHTFRDEIELMIIKWAIKEKKPLFGICRGLEVINTFFGGSLYQDIKNQAKVKLLHYQKEIEKLSHKVVLEKDSFLWQLYQKKEVFVNSFHHQAIKKLGGNLKIAAKSSDGIIEAIQHDSLPIFGVQWHPEVSYNFDVNSKKLIKFFKKII